MLADRRNNGNWDRDGDLVINRTWNYGFLLRLSQIPRTLSTSGHSRLTGKLESNTYILYAGHYRNKSSYEALFHGSLDTLLTSLK